MNQESKKSLAEAKEHIDNARALLDSVRFNDECYLTGNEYNALSEIHSLLCEATDIYYMMNV